MLVLDLGCGRNKVKMKDAEVIGIDIVKSPGVDMVWDLEKGIPFNDNSVDHIYCYHVLEHIDNIVYFLEEVSRVLKPDGIIEIRVPHFTSRGAYTCFQHKHFFTYDTFRFIGEESDKKDGRYVSSKTNLRLVERRLITPYPVLKSIAGKFPEVYERFLSRFLPCSELRAKFKKVETP